MPKVKEEAEVEKWLQDLQSRQVLSREYQTSRLGDIQRWSGVGGELFDSILIYENYPVSEAAYFRAVEFEDA